MFFKSYKFFYPYEPPRTIKKKSHISYAILEKK